MNRNLIKGGVILMGSLFWEDEQNAIDEQDKIVLAKYRRKWREKNLSIKSATNDVALPIRYGRCSSSRKDTYTMVFSESCAKGSGIIVPFKKVFSVSNKYMITSQIKRLAQSENIYPRNGAVAFACVWGVVSIWINPDSKLKINIERYWNRIIKNKKYQFFNHPAANYEWNDGCLINNEYKLSVKIDTDIDFLLCTYILPKFKRDDRDSNRANNTRQGYPEPNRIFEAINQSAYKTYFQQNVLNGITTYQDSEIEAGMTDC